MAIPGQGTVDAMGGFDYTIPIQVPPGTHGVAPHLALTYSSSAGDGIMGIGWRVSGLSEIARCPQTYAQDGAHGGVNDDSNDRFCLDGQRLVVIGGTYGAAGSEYRTEIESFRKVVAQGQVNATGPDHFDVWTADGTHYQYGNSASGPNSQVLDSFGNVRVWALSSVTDTHGNTITYTYNSGNTLSYYPVEIDYTSNGTTAAQHSVKFLYNTHTSSRPDQVPAYQAGSELLTTVLLGDIETFKGTGSGAVLIEDYQLFYTPESASGAAHDELSSIKLCDASLACLPATNFTWQGSGNNPTVGPQSMSIANGLGLTSGDFGGRGITDALVLESSSCPAGYSDIYSGNAAGTAFTAAGYNAKFDTFSPSGNTPIHNDAGACFPNADSVVADIDGDGFDDLAIDVDEYDPHAVPTTEILLNNESGKFNQKSTDLAYVYPFLLTRSYNTLPSDYNDDGLADAFYADSSWIPYAELSNGDGTFSSATSSALPSGTWWLAGNFSGNGCTSLLLQGATAALNVYCKPASARYPTTASVTQYTSGVPNFGTGANLLIEGDFNGDGKTDILVLNSGANAQLYLSTGTGFVLANTLSGTSNWASDYTVVSGDWNGDGKDDIALISNSSAHNHIVMLSNGTSFSPLGSAITNSTNNDYAVVADWNNDGAMDFWLKRPTGGDMEYLFAYTPELMTKVTDGLTATITATYNRINNSTSLYTKSNTAAYPNQDVAGPIYVVSNLSRSNGVGGYWNWAYQYSGLKRDLSGRGLLGFQQIVFSDPDGSTHTLNYGNSSGNMSFPFNTTIASQSVTNAGVTLSSFTDTWSYNNAYCANGGNPNYVLCLETRVAAGADLDGTTLPSTTTTWKYDANGNLHVRALTLADGFTSTTTNTFTTDTGGGGWIIDEPVTSKTENIIPGSSDLIRDASFTETNGDTGDITEDWMQYDDSTNSLWLKEDFGHDTFGNVTTTTYSGPSLTTRTWTVGWNTTTYGGSYPTSQTNPLSQTSALGYDTRFGETSSFSDANSPAQTASWTYDTYGRPKMATGPDGSVATITYLYCSPSTCPSNAFYSAETTHAGPGAVQNAPSTIAYYDSLNRLVAEDRQGFDGTFVRVASTYDANGNIQQTSHPYRIGIDTPVYTTYTYDALHRVLTKSGPSDNDSGHVITTTYAYDALDTTVTDDQGITTLTVKNDEGWVQRVTQNGGPSTLYSYDAFGDPVQIVAPTAFTITNTFDVRGRKLTSNDPDMGGTNGSWSYQYDPLSELTFQQDPKGQQTTLGYDAVGRLTTRTEPDMQSSWTYDTVANGVGKLTQEACSAGASGNVCPSSGFTRKFAYDTHGRQTGITLQFGVVGASYFTTEQYDTNSALLTSVRAFSGFTTQDVYNSYGYQCQIVDGSVSGPTCSGTSQVYWQANAADAYLHLTQETAGNGVVTNHAFWPNTGTPEQITANGPGHSDNNITNVAYTWDTVGNLTSRSDTLHGGYTENFCYAPLGKLAGSDINGDDTTCTTGTNVKSIAYDTTHNNGNIASKSDVGTYSYGVGAPGPHAVTSVALCTGCTYQGISQGTSANANFFYDYNGNMLCVTAHSSCTSSATLSYSWTSFNMAASISQVGGTNTSSFAYGPEHERLTQTVSAGTLTYASDPVGLVMGERFQGSTTTWRTYLIAWGHIVAERFTQGSSVSMYYFTGDHLTSTSALTDSSGALQESDSYDSWGRRRNADGTDRTNCSTGSLTLRGYTSQEMLDNFCLVNLTGRLYDPTLGRMTSADPTVPGPMNPQAFNRYSYVTNQPLSATDPSGYATDYCALMGGCKIVAISPNDLDTSSMAGELQFSTPVVNFAPTFTTGTMFGDNDIDMTEGGEMLSLISAGMPGNVDFGMGQVLVPTSSGYTFVNATNLAPSGGFWRAYSVGVDDMNGQPTTFSAPGYMWISNPGFVSGSGWGSAQNNSFGLRGTLQVGIGVQGNWKIPGTPFGGSFIGSVGFAFDTHLNVAGYATYGGAAAAGQIGEDETAGFTAQLSNAATVDDLAGPFNTGNLSAGEAMGGAVDYFTGSSADGQVFGMGFTFGEGEGISGVDGFTNTVMCSSSQGCHK
jgi:RHS repeat-associated protein